jgi:cytoskeletal protein RodZ
MSLISEALKKAQRERHATPTESPAPRPHSGPPRRRAQSFSPTTLILVGAGIVALFVVSVVSAVLWINQPSPASNLTAKPTPPRALPNPSPSAPTANPTATPTAPPIAAANAASVAPAPSLASIQPAPTTTPTKVPLGSTFTPTPSMSTAPAATPNPFTPTILSSPPTPAAAASFDPNIQTIIDTWRIAGIRSSGDYSKVFLNDRIYKINDLVDVARGIRLTQVTPKNLTFTTPDGISYVRKF